LDGKEPKVWEEGAKTQGDRSIECLKRFVKNCGKAVSKAVESGERKGING
jgi:hypothetical protein